MNAQSNTAEAATAFKVLAAISVCHFLNDMMQSLLPAIYPILKENYGLDFGQVGLLTFTFQFTASLLQPIVGVYTDLLCGSREHLRAFVKHLGAENYQPQLLYPSDAGNRDIDPLETLEYWLSEESDQMCM